MADILATFAHGLRAAGAGWTARCPAHEDARNSLSLGRGDDGRWLLKCHAGCTVEAILSAAHLQSADLFSPKTDAGHGSIIATFDYRDEHGVLLYQVCRFEPKDFRQRAADGSWSIKGLRRVLYRLPELAGRRTVFVAEGEKDADRLWSLGLPATTNAGGAGKWRTEYAAMLTAAGCKHVIVLPDNDAPGEAHGRDVARSCVAAGLDVKLIPLPGLPRKGDVSDYLAHHSKDELTAVVVGAPLFTPQRLVAGPQPITLTSLADLLSEPDDLVDWLVEDRIPAGAVILLVAAPKAGKSTIARELAAAVSRGVPWLGWRTSRGTVWLLIFQDKRSEVRKHFRRIGVNGDETIRFFIDQAPADLLPRLHALAEQERPALIVVDMLSGLLPVKDMNDYAQVTQRFAPLLNLSRASGAALLLLHHGSAHGVAREGLDAALGSTALSGCVDNVLVLKRTDHQRALSSVQRIGPDLEPTVIVLNPDTGRLELGGRKCDVDDADLGLRVVAALRTAEEGVTEPWIQDQIGGRKSDEVRVLRRLIGVGQVRKVSGAGRKGDPWRYGLVEKFGSHDVAPGADSQKTSGTEKTAPEADNPGLFDVAPKCCSAVPSYSREQNSTYVPTTKIGSKIGSDPSRSGDSVPAVPDLSQNSGNGTSGTANTPDKHCPEFGSRNSETGPNDERPSEGDSDGSDDGYF